MNKKKEKITITLLLFIALIQLIACIDTGKFQLIRHPIEDELIGPRCLDGSPAALYIDQGVENKFIVYFQGGGLCRGDGLSDMLDYCLKRSFTDLGSSKSYPDFFSFDNHPLLSPQAKANPLYHNWTRIFIPYCDGSIHQGFRSTPVSYRGSKLYFRGEKNTLAHFNYLQEKYSFFNAQKLVITGTSAGAMATYLWGNHVYHNALNKDNVFLLPDSGIFLTDFVNPWTNRTLQYYTQSLYELVLAQTQLPLQQCAQKYPALLECFNAGNIAEFLLPKTLIIQSTYDAWGLEQILQLHCLTHPPPSSIDSCNDQQRAVIQNYHMNLQQAIANYTKIERHGVWAIGCVQHGFVENGQSYANDKFVSPYPQGETLAVALDNFMKGQKIREIDSESWPFNKGCCGMKGIFNLMSE